MKNLKLTKMLLSLGHTVYFYGSEGSNIKEYCGDQPGKLIYVQTHTLKDIQNDYGDGYNLDSYPSVGYDWHNADFRHDFSSDRKQSTLKFYKNTIAAINVVKKHDDFLLMTQGSYHEPIAKAVGLYLTCEPGIGYRGSIKGRFRAFESSYIQNFTYGSEAPFESINGSYYDRVIPNYFDPADVEFSDKKDDYYLFIGRMIKRKGIITAALACNAIGKKLIIAGQGAHVDSRGHLIPNEDPDFDLEPGTWEYVGYCDVEKRKKYMSRAIATFTPTEYLECFAGTHVESMLHGTPCITTNFAVYPGTIHDTIDGMFPGTKIRHTVGFKCNTLQDFVTAARKARYVDHQFVRRYGERFLMDNVKLEFQQWFDDMYAVWESTQDTSVKGWSRVV
jgi:glycosyltransferase involved in cell wall biosynthesis